MSGFILTGRLSTDNVYIQYLLPTCVGFLDKLCHFMFHGFVILKLTLLIIRRRSGYIIGFIAQAIGPNKSRKLTQLIAPAHNIRGKVWMENNTYGFTDDNCLSMKPCVLFFIQTLKVYLKYIVCQRYKLCEFLGFVWTDCWGNKSYYVTTSLANSDKILPKYGTVLSVPIDCNVVIFIDVYMQHHSEIEQFWE